MFKKNAGPGIIASRLYSTPMAPEGTEPSSGGGPQPLSPTVPPGAPPPGTPAPVSSAPPPNVPAPGSSTFGELLDRAGNDGKPVSMPANVIKKMKEAERAKGSKAALEALAKDLGFNTPEEIKKFVAEARARPQQPKRNGTQPQNGAPVDKQVQQLSAQAERERSEKVLAQRKARAAETLLAQERAKAAIEKELIRHGVNDVDYAYTLVEREMGKIAAGKKDDEVEAAMRAFDLGKYINESLRKERPFLFAVEMRPATTGPGPTSAPPPPKAPAMVPAGGAPTTDVRKMTKQEFNDYLRKKGLGRQSVMGPKA